jgi:hypothetical protein
VVLPTRLTGVAARLGKSVDQAGHRRCWRYAKFSMEDLLAGGVGAAGLVEIAFGQVDTDQRQVGAFAKRVGA